jgi:hypothetical protein
MYLLRVRLSGVGPFGELVVPLSDEEGQARLVTVVHGGGGVGKTTLLGAIAATRPGNTLPQPPRPRDRESTEEETPPFVLCEWLLGRDDPERPHPLRVTGPNIRLDVDVELETLRRREQALFDRMAREGGFAFLAFSSTRWFSRQPIGFSAPGRTIARYDVRSPSALDDASRSDLARETKQALAYAAITAALDTPRSGKNFAVLGDTMKSAVDELVGLAGYAYAGLDAGSFEPLFVDAAGRVGSFDTLPTRARHLVAFAALSVRTLWGAYPGRDPREMEGLVVIDEVDAHQDPAVETRLVAALKEALPNVQWILTTTSPVVAGSCDTRDVLALRRLPEQDRVELFLGSEARVH